MSWSWWSTGLGLLVVGVVVGLALSSLVTDRVYEIENLVVGVTGRDYRYYFQYAGADRQLHSADDRHGVQNLHVPHGARVHLELTSDDYVYLLEIPELDIYEVLAPGLKFSVQFDPPSEGSYELLGSQMCGYDHEELLGKLIVESPSSFWHTVRALRSTPLQANQQTRQ
jgi:cytochrome c oxidase subunit 2